MANPEDQAEAAAASLAQAVAALAAGQDGLYQVMITAQRDDRGTRYMWSWSHWLQPGGRATARGGGSG